MGLVFNVNVYRGGQPVGQLAFDSDTNRTIKIGRLSSAQLKVDDPSVARIHAVVELSGTDVSLVDMGSSSGTQVNGAKVHKVKLNHGDQVTIGDTTLVLGVGAPPPVPGQAQAAPAAAPGFAPPPGFQPTARPGVAPTMPAMAGPPGTIPGTPPAPGARGSMPGMQAPFPGAQPSPAAPPTAMPAAMPGQVPESGPPAAGAPVPSQAPPDGAAEPVQPRFDGGAKAAPVRRITGARLAGAAVESRPHPGLPPESQMSVENRMLEMRVYWGDALLYMHHYTKPKRITIGEVKGTDIFISSEGLPIEVFPLIRFIGDDYVLTFCAGMEGEVEIDGTVVGLATLRGSSMASKDPELEGSYQVKLPMKARGVVHWGGATFALRFVAPAKTVPNPFMQNLDLPYLNTWVASLFLHVAVLVTLMVYPYDTDALRVDLFDAPDRFAQLVLEGPQETKSTRDLLDRLKKAVEEKKEEIKPKEKKPDLKNVTKIKPVKKTKQQIQKERQEKVQEKFSKMFTGSSGSQGSLLGGGGGGTLTGTLSNVIGTTGKGSATAGIAGLGIRGSGPLTGGGIGTSRGIAGIGTAGRLGGGGMAYGSGVGLKKKRDRGMINIGAPLVMGALPPDVIKRVINQNKAQIRYCYEVELQRNQNLEGRVMMSWIIAATGLVSTVKVKETSLRNANVERCIAAKIKGWRFPKPAGGGVVQVNYPFVFRAG